MPPFDPNRAKRPSAFVGIPEIFLILIGHVVGAWSQFDLAFNRLLKAFLIADGTASDRWEMNSFKTRSTRLRQACKVRFSSHSSLLRCICDLISDASRLQTDRNRIARMATSAREPEKPAGGVCRRRIARCLLDDLWLATARARHIGFDCTPPIAFRSDRP